MNIFRLDFSGRGGRVVAGDTTPDFVDYWVDQENIKLVQQLFKLSVSERFGDEDSPAFREDDVNSIYECTELEDYRYVETDNGYKVVPMHYASANNVRLLNLSDDVDHVAYIEKHCVPLMDQEKHYDFDIESAHVRDINLPCLAREDSRSSAAVFLYNSSTGDNGYTYVMTEQDDFDPSRLKVGVTDTNMGVFVTDFWYAGEKLEVIYSDKPNTVSDTGLYVVVGYIDKKTYQYDF